MDKLSIQEQILFDYAVREAAYDMGLLDEKPKSLKEDAQDFCEAWIEEWKRQSNKDKNMEIKQGDKVRVSKDAPKMYLRGWAQIFQIREAEVTKVEDGNAVIETFELSIAIPTKYLVKVDAEAKEAKYHKGDRIKFKNIYELQKVKDKSFRWMLVMFASKEATITAVEDNGFYRVDIDPSIGGINDDMIECKVEPMEQTEAEKKPNIGSIKIPVEVDLTDSYWDAYAADLAKEIVLKTVNSASDKRPSVIAEYATDVAKSVVEGLKGSEYG